MKSYLATLILIPIIIIPLLIHGYHVNASPTKVKSPITYHATVCEYFKKAGTNKWILIGCKHNTLTDIGKNFIKNQLINPNASIALKYISLGTNPSDCSSSATVLSSEITSNGLSRHECTLANGTGYGNWTCTYLFTATGNVNGVQVAGYNWEPTPASDGNLFACATFGSVDMQANDQIKIIWDVTVSES